MSEGQTYKRVAEDMMQSLETEVSRLTRALSDRTSQMGVLREAARNFVLARAGVRDEPDKVSVYETDDPLFNALAHVVLRDGEQAGEVVREAFRLLENWRDTDDWHERRDVLLARWSRLTGGEK